MFHLSSLTLLLLICMVAGSPFGRDPENDNSPRRKRHHQQLPPFAWNTSIEAQRELKKIIKSKTLTKQQVDDEVISWANKQGPSVVAAVEEHLKQMQQRNNEMKKAIEASSYLGSAAQDALLNITAIIANKSLTRYQEKEQINAVYDSLLWPVYREVKRYMHQNFERSSRFKRSIEANTAEQNCDYPSSEEYYDEEYDYLPPLSFLNEVNAEARKEFEIIRFNSSISGEAKMKAMENWAKQQGPEIEAELNEAFENTTASFKQALAIIEHLQNINKSVRNALKQIVQNNANMKLSDDQRFYLNGLIMNALPEQEVEEVANEMYKLCDLVCSAII